MLLAVALLLALGLGGCSTTRLLYANADWLVYQALDNRFGVRPDQEDWIRASIDSLHGRHRVTELPAYRESIEELSVRFADGLDAADLVWLDRRFERHRRALVELAVPQLARFLADLDKDQLARFVEVSGEDIDDAAEPLAWSRARRQAHRFDTFVDRIEVWTGELSVSQLRELRVEVAALSDIRREWIDHRRQRLRTLADLLRSDPDRASIATALYHWWGNTDQGYRPTFAAQVKLLKEQIFNLVLRLDSRLTRRQREHVLDRLQGYISNIDIVVAARE